MKYFQPAPETSSFNRRSLVAGGALAATAALIGLPTQAVNAAPSSDDEGVTAPEDLMKEHGVLNRCLLIYEEGIRRISAKEEVPPDVFHQTANLVKRFVEEYHEKNEEKYIF